MKLSALDRFDMREYAIEACDAATMSRVAIGIPPVQALHDLLQDRGLKIVFAGVFHTTPFGFLQQHIDGSVFEPIVKLNFVYGAPTSSMIWYKLKPNVQKEMVERLEAGDRLPYMGFEGKDCVRVHSEKQQGANLVNAGEVHSVFNPSSEHRWCLTLSVRNLDGSRPLFSEVATKLEDMQ